MQRVLIVATCLLLVASRAVAQDRITVYADVSGRVCSIADTSPSIFTVFVLHTHMIDAITVDMSVVESSGFAATFVEEDIPFLHIGTFRDGVSVSYGECKTSSQLVGTITYQGHGTSQACSKLDTAGNPGSPCCFTTYALVQDCVFTLYQAPAVTPLWVNPSLDCPAPCVVATETVTWGRVKALYRN